jgi:hypothetical protein
MTSNARALIEKERTTAAIIARPPGDEVTLPNLIA